MQRYKKYSIDLEHPYRGINISPSIAFEYFVVNLWRYL